MHFARFCVRERAGTKRRMSTSRRRNYSLTVSGGGGGVKGWKAEGLWKRTGYLPTPSFPFLLTWYAQVVCISFPCQIKRINAENISKMVFQTFLVRSVEIFATFLESRNLLGILLLDSFFAMDLPKTAFVHTHNLQLLNENITVQYFLGSWKRVMFLMNFMIKAKTQTKNKNQTSAHRGLYFDV